MRTLRVTWLVSYLLALPLGCTSSTAPSATVSGNHRSAIVDGKAKLLAQFQAAFACDDMQTAERALREIVRRPDATAKELAALGDLLTERKDYAGAEVSYRKALSIDGRDDVVAWSLGRTLTLMGRPQAAADLLERRQRGTPELDRHAETVEILGLAYRELGDRASMCRMGVLGILLAPRSTNSWDTARACTAAETKAAVGALPSGVLPGFAAVLAEGPISEWDIHDLVRAVHTYQSFAKVLETARRPALAKRYRQASGIVFVYGGIMLARENLPRDCLDLLSRADDAAIGIENLPLEYQVAALRDTIISYTRIRGYLEALESVDRLFELCHSDPTNPWKCPVFAVAEPMFAGSAQLKGIDEQLFVHLAHLGLVLRDARANVSFDLDSGTPRFLDGHDYVGERIRDESATPVTPTRAYAATSPEEDRVMFWMFLNHPDASEVVQREMAAGRFEIPVKALLVELGVGAMLGVPSIPRVVHNGLFVETTVEALRKRIRAAPVGSVPKPTLVGFAVAERAIEVFRRIEPWISKPPGGAAVQLLPRASSDKSAVTPGALGQGPCASNHPDGRVEPLSR